MSYPALIACYRSGQIPEAAWQEHLRDPLFRLWLDKFHKEHSHGHR